MDETDLIKLSILGRYKKYRVNEKNRKNLLQIAVHRKSYSLPLKTYYTYSYITIGHDACYQQMLKQKAVFRKDLNETLRLAYLF